MKTAMATSNNLGKISVSKHATDNAISRFNINPLSAVQWIKDNVELSTYVADVIGDDGRPGRLFAYQRVAFILADTTDFVLTLYPQHVVDADLRLKVRKLINRELAAAERVQQAAVHKANVARAKLEIEIAVCNYRMNVTPSKSVISSNVRQLERISDDIARIDAELMEVRRNKSRIAKSVAVYI